MADTDTATLDPTSQPIGDLAGSVTRDLAKIQPQLVKMDREKLAADQAAVRQNNKRQEEDRARYTKAFEAEGATAETLNTSWNADKEHKKFETDPIAGIGSVGGLFAMLASAFTKAPMLSALEGMTGALNGIKEGNEADYTRAYESWKENLKLAEARQKMEHQAFTDAVALSEHDQRLSDAKLKANFDLYGDLKAKVLHENGMIPELYEYMNARNKSMQSTLELGEAKTLHDFQMRQVNDEFKAIDQSQLPDQVKAARKTAAVLSYFGNKAGTSAEYQIGAQIMHENADKPTAEVVQQLQDAGVIKPQMKPEEYARQETFNRRKQALVDQGLWTPEKETELINEVWPKGRSGASQSEKTVQEEAKNIYEGIKAGRQTPMLTGLSRGGLAAAVKSLAEQDKFDLSKAQLEWNAAQKQVQAVNSPQMTRFVGLNRAVDNSIDEVNRLAREMHNSGIPMLNALKLKELINLEGNSPRGILATKYMTAVGIVKEEFANLANGGYAPTVPAWHLAEQQVNGNYGMDQLGASLGEIQRLIRFRLKNVPNLDKYGPDAPNRYRPDGEKGSSDSRGADADSAPPVHLLEAGVAKAFKNGTYWTLKDGKPVQVEPPK